MGALSNAVALLKDPVFRDWCLAAGAYQARQVVLEDPSTADHDLRLRLALDVLSSPGMVTDKLVTVISTDPEVAALGSSVESIPEATMLQKVADVWTTLAGIMY